VLSIEDGFIRIESPDPMEYLDAEVEKDTITIRQPNFGIDRIKLEHVKLSCKGDNAMLAAKLENKEQLVIKEIERPKLNDGEALIKVLYAGVCGSDVTVYSGKHPTATFPVVLGHEVLGIIEDIRSDKPVQFKIGDRVTVDPLISCGVCEACRKGFSHVCKELKLLGIHEDGDIPSIRKHP